MKKSWTTEKRLYYHAILKKDGDKDNRNNWTITRKLFKAYLLQCHSIISFNQADFDFKRKQIGWYSERKPSIEDCQDRKLISNHMLFGHPTWKG